MENKQKAILFEKLMTFLKYFILAVGAFVMMFPFIWMVCTSLKTGGESIAIPPTLFPEQLRWENYAKAWELVPWLTYFRNTVFVSAVATGITCLFTILAAYAFTVFDFKGKNVMFMLFLSTMMIPSELLIIQNYITVSSLGWLDTFKGIILPSVGSGFYVFMMREYFMQVPSILYKAAKMDGCGDWKYLWRIMVPVNKNAIATVCILNFIAHWNAFLWPMMVTNSDSKRVLSIGLLHFKSSVSSEVNMQMVGTTIVLVPMVIFYLVFRKQIISGVSRSGIKG